jgi:hypothetical protein
MQEILIQKFHHHLKENHPELVIQLQEEARLPAYLKDAILSVEDLINDLLKRNVDRREVEDVCLETLIQSLPPSRFNYLQSVLQNEFEEQYESFRRVGISIPELLNLITYCDPVFEGLGFSEEDRHLRYAIIGTVDDYFQTVLEAKEL